MHAEKINLLNLSLKQLKNWMIEQGQAAYRAEQLLLWIHQRGITDFSQMTNLSQSFRHLLEAETEIRIPSMITEKISSDGTCKWLLRLDALNAIETVFIPCVSPDPSISNRSRGTLCVSSQVGCALNCSFCATGKAGFNRNLSLAEIIGQVWFAVHRLAEMPDQPELSNVVMMGMGEPLLNYQPVVDAMELMLNDHAYGLSKYRVTLSTSGVIPALQQLKVESEVSLAVSLHAAHDELRNILVPLNKKYPLDELLPVCRDYFPAASKRVVTFEYVMLEDINDSLKDAEALIRRLANVPCKINLIPFNPFPGTQYRCSNTDVIARFQNRLMAAGFNTRVRRTRGRDTESACGQLAGAIKDRTGRHAKWVGKVVSSAL